MSGQIALLIDTYVDDTDLNQLPAVSNAISLTAFRLLHFLSAKFEKKGFEKTSKLSHTAVKWGYKFFNSRSFVTRIEQHRLRDFKLKYFEEFENEIQRRLENKPQCLEKAVKKIKPCECIAKALTELLSDFPWERPDITSPVRGRKRKKEVDSRNTCNLAVLFTRCPKNGPELKLFTGKQVPDTEVFLDSLLSPALFHQFCNITQLSLSWIDTEELISSSLISVDPDSVNIVQDALSKARGKLIPVSAVVHRGLPHFSSLSVLGDVGGQERDSRQNQGPGDKTTFLLPFTTTLDYLLFNPKKHNVVCGKKTNFTALLQLSDKQSCSITLKPMVKENPQRMVLLLANGVDPDEMSLYDAGFHLGLQCLPEYTFGSHCNTGNSIEKYDPEILTTNQAESSHGDRLFELLEAPTLQPYSVMLNNDNLQPMGTQKFVCSEVVYQTEGSGSVSGQLTKLIDRMKRRNVGLVLLCVQTKQLLFLEPLTTYTASLWLLPTGKQLQLEKELFSQKTLVTSPHDKADGFGCENLIQRLVASGQSSKFNGALQQEEKCGSKCDVTMMDRWHIPGSSRAESLSTLINKLNERISELDFLTEAEAGTLRQLQKAYRQENKPPGLRDTSLTNFNDSSHFNSTLDDLSKLDSSKTSKKTNRQSVSRGELIISLSKTKEGEKERGQMEKEAGSVAGKKEKEKPEIEAQLCDFKSTDELKGYLTSMYERALTGEVTAIDISVQTMSTVVLHYMKHNTSEDPEKSSKDLLEEALLMSGSMLREKYSKRSDEGVDDKQEKILDYQFQVLLRLEILSSLINKDQTLGEEDSNDEIVGLLRAISFISEPSLLSKFLERTVVYNYVHTIPRTLANIYDELMQPLPGILSNQLSPNTSGDHSDVNTSLIGLDDTLGPPSSHTRSHGSVGPPSSQPGSNRSVGMDMISSSQKGGRKLIHHPSLADFGAKRQIVVQKVPKAKEKSSKKRKRKPSGKSEKDRISKRLFDGSRGGTKLERRQSVAVMQRTHKTPKKSKSKYLLKSPGKGLVSPRRNIVAETPNHKQKSQVLRYKPAQQENDSLEVDTGIVEESPLKQFQGASHQDSPTKALRAKALLRRSFYSAGPVKRTRNLTKYFQLADKIAGRERHTSGNNTQPKLPKLISFEAPSSEQSPRKNSSFLLSQLMSSPSPAKRTPRKGFLSPSPTKRLTKGLSSSKPSPAKHSQRQLVLDSPSTKKTPRKLTGTPSKTVADSPSTRTRSRYDGAFVIPSAAVLMSPVSRRQSPRILAADSGTKGSEVSPDKTPVKSPFCGTISTGLDSPTQESRLRTASTPTRKSVRAALFARSPVIKKCNSSITSTDVSSLKTNLMLARSSPRKHLANEISSCLSPRKQVANENLSFMSPKKLHCSISPQKSISTRSLEIDSVKDNLTSNPGDPTEDLSLKSLSRNESAVFDKCNSLNFGLTPNSKRGPTLIQKTPSPSKKHKTKTPDSFDKWHRRKPRSSQSSPACMKKSPEKVKPLLDSSDNINMNISEQNIGNLEPLKTSLSQNKDFSLRKKRSLIASPDKVEESPGKRRRISRMKSIGLSSRGSVQGSQGFDVTGSISELSQNSNVSALDYFSASNDEVFLSQEDRLASEDVEMEDIENYSKANLDLLKHSHPSSGWKSPRHKTLHRLTSGEFSPSGIQDQRSDSPVFGQSKKSTPIRNPSSVSSKLISDGATGEDDHVNMKDSPSERESPGFRRSPANKKFSPVVSAKSLMHLIQSPLLTSPKNERKSALDMGSPRSRRHAGDRSRRSLKMQQ